MRSTLLPLLSLLTLAPFVAADLHHDIICATKVGGATVYHADATNKACAAYRARNTGSQQWDTCPDCTVVLVGNLNICHSEGKHIGGDEMQYYCKQNGAMSVA
ncbi:hypothetical protein P153DRAFT_346859 [Dothidotthia symphoricarpi CBS 119687]|uniref:Uncharacterized protein n=1 Tax=Dothidotthia symphoricarpi CBS 119687 TaxID=1392245 RepID=A0A6A6A2L5_9PLEO|nr:uncharacterized protein P153DRAFT_346859 [Dothidotthia symphoricarpi CBS 119687]KAF2126040.1 hypothetical protein P153DRAFT_346859 [Dothidotthia symphoricarpi CBS 119687]